jgi:hypothetical protein
MTLRTVTSRLASASLPLALALAPACAGLVPPARSSGPAISPQGVQIAVVKQQCTQTQEPDQPDNDLAEEIVDVQVRNVAAGPVMIVRTDFRLLTPDGFALKDATWGSADPLVVNGGDTRVFELRFMSRGSLECGRELELDAGTGVSLGKTPVKLSTVRFVPRSSRSSTAPEKG